MNSILAGTLLLTATGLFSQVVGFFYRILLSRLIGAETMGLYQLVMPVYSMFMSLTAIGLTVAVSTLSARYHALGDRGAVRGALRRALVCFFLVAVPLGAVTSQARSFQIKETAWNTMRSKTVMAEEMAGQSSIYST